MAKLPTMRLTREYLKTLGLVEHVDWEKTEHPVYGTGRSRRHRTRDLFGFIDVVVMEKCKQGLLAVQVTDWTHVANRIKKAQSNAALRNWLDRLNRAEVWAWKEYMGDNRTIIIDNWDVRDGSTVRAFWEGEKIWLLKVRTIGLVSQ